MGGSEINSSGCGGNDGGNGNNKGSSSDGKIDGGGDRRRLMDAMVKVQSDKFRQI